MAFPTNLDSTSTIPVEASGTALSVNHVTNHTASQTAILAIEAKVGIDSSAVTTSHDYKLSGVTGSDKALKSGTSTQSVTGLTLVTPKITVGSDAVGDLHYTSNVDGTQSRLAVGADNYILKINGSAIGWEAETATVNGSTTAAGIFEAGTSAEVTAGTATGGTGAVLAVTPDALAASTPVFNGSGLTNIPRWLTSGAPGTTTTNTTATVLTYALAGGTLSTNKGVKLRVTIQSAVSASNSGATYTVQYGGATIGTFGYAGNSGTPTVTAVSVIDILLLGSGATGTQRYNVLNNTAIISGSGGGATGGIVQSGSASIDSTTSQNITISCTAGASVTGTLSDYFIEKIV